MGGFPFYALAIKTHRLDGRQKKNQQQRLEKKIVFELVEMSTSQSFMFVLKENHFLTGVQS